MHHLHRVAGEHESNNMTASNPAIVFGPTLLKRNESIASLSTVMDTLHQARTVELLTIYVNEIFGPADHCLPKSYSRSRNLTRLKRPVLSVHVKLTLFGYVTGILSLSHYIKREKPQFIQSEN